MYAMTAADKASMDAFSIQQIAQDIEGMHEQIFDHSEMLQEKFDSTEDNGDDDWSHKGAWREELAELSFRGFQLSNATMRTVQVLTPVISTSANYTPKPKCGGIESHSETTTLRTQLCYVSCSPRYVSIHWWRSQFLHRGSADAINA